MDSAPSQRPLRALALAATCLALVSLQYRRAFALPFMCDDWFLVYEAGHLQSPWQQLGFGWGAFQQWLRPVVLVSFRVQMLLCGASPLAHHAFNVLTHATSTFLLGWVVYRCGAGRFQAWAAALLFAIYPLNVEATAWVCARSDSLCGAFCFGALGCALSYVERPRAASATRAALLFALALGSKESALALPLFAWLLLPSRDGERRRLRLVVVGGGAVLVLAYVVLRWRVLGGFGGYAVNGENAHFVGGARAALRRLVETALTLASPLQRDMLPAALAFVRWIPLALCAVAFAIAWRAERRVATLALVRVLALYLVSMATLATWWEFEGGLRGQRSLYLPSALACTGFALALGALARSAVPRWSAFGLLALPFAWATDATLVQWRDGGVLSDRVLTRVLDRASAREDKPVWFVVGAPDSRGPAFIFRNGLTQAVWLLLGPLYDVYPLVPEEEKWFDKPPEVRNRFLRRTYATRRERAIVCLKWDDELGDWREL